MARFDHSFPKPLKESYNEIELLMLLRQGDQAAFSRIYDEYKGRLSYKLLILVKDEKLAEELLQDLFLKVWENRERIDLAKSFKAYLYKITQNSVVDLYRRAKRENEVLTKMKAANTEFYSHVEELILQKENEELLEALLLQLPPKRREIFIQCKLYGRSYKEVSEEYNISVTTVNDHIQKSMIFLKNKINKGGSIPYSLLLIYLFS